MARSKRLCLGASWGGWGREQWPPPAEGFGHWLRYRALSAFTSEKIQPGQIFTFGPVKPTLNLATVQLQRHQNILSFQRTLYSPALNCIRSFKNITDSYFCLVFTAMVISLQKKKDNNNNRKNRSEKSWRLPNISSQGCCWYSVLPVFLSQLWEVNRCICLGEEGSSTSWGSASVNSNSVGPWSMALFEDCHLCEEEFESSR